MAASYGVESLGDTNKYRLSFTVGGLLEPQGVLLARLFADMTDITCDRVVGEDIVRVRKAAIDGNVLGMRSHTSNVRFVSETSKRLSALSVREITYLASAEASYDDRSALMWVAMCRYYRIVGVFAKDVLRGNFLAGKETVNKDDYDRFMRNAAMWHPEIEQLSELTYRKLRQNVFHAMDDARLTKGTDHEIVPALLSNGLLAILEDMVTAFEFFPMYVPSKF